MMITVFSETSAFHFAMTVIHSRPSQFWMYLIFNRRHTNEREYDCARFLHSLKMKKMSIVTWHFWKRSYRSLTQQLIVWRNKQLTASY